MTAPRLVFLDVDGTLIDYDHRLAPSTVDAVRAARARGHRVLTCTGRSPREIPDDVAAIGWDGSITAGGGFTHWGGELLASRTMPAESLARIIEVFRAHRIEFNLQGLDGVVRSPGLAARIEALRASGPSERALPGVRVAADDSPVVGSFAKATFYGEHLETFATVRDALGHEFHVITGTIPYLGEAGGEIAPIGMDKGAAVVDLAERLGVALADTVAIGDSINDVEMFDVVGLAVAMGDAPQHVIARAHEVTTSVHDDGVYRAFERHGLT